MVGVGEAVRNWRGSRRRLFGVAGQAGVAVTGAIVLSGCGDWLPVDEEEQEPVALPREAGVTSENTALVLPPSDSDPEGQRMVVFRPVSIEGIGSLLGLRVDDEGQVWPVNPSGGYELRERDGAPQEVMAAATLLGVVAVHGVDAGGASQTLRFVSTHPDFAGQEIDWSADREFTIGDALALGGVGLLSPVPADFVEQLGPVVQV